MNSVVFFFRYAFPCAESLHISERITPDDFRALEAIADNGSCVPDKGLLERCFPLAVESLRRLGEESGYSDPWHMDNVSDFWRNRHTDHHTPVHIETVDFVRGDGFVVTYGIKEKDILFLVNRYGLPLSHDDRVYVHNRVVVERIEHHA